jgi:nucleoid-associated protein YgaU
MEARCASRCDDSVMRVAFFRFARCAAPPPAWERASVTPEYLPRGSMPMPLSMSDPVLAAIIAGSATLSASLLQLRTAALRDGARGQSGPAARRKSRLQRIVLLVIIGAAAVSGFALSQWLTEGERTAQTALQHELQARVAELGRTAGELEATRQAARAEIETGVVRRIGTDGVAVTATVAACRPAAAAPAAASAAADPAAAAAAPACSEADAVPVTLCAAIPANATVTEVALFSRPAGTDTPWNASRFLPGQETGQARFADKYSEGTPEDGTRQVCQAFTHWSAEHARVVRVIVHYSL